MQHLTHLRNLIKTKNRIKRKSTEFFCTTAKNSISNESEMSLKLHCRVEFLRLVVKINLGILRKITNVFI